jgi:hypothetical protein
VVDHVKRIGSASSRGRVGVLFLDLARGGSEEGAEALFCREGETSEGFGDVKDVAREGV